jgi:L-gulono-1,4-lactone dehydrogenase
MVSASLETRRLSLGRARTLDSWTNWAGDQSCSPARVERARSREELADAIVRAAEEGLAVRVPGAGHSFSEAALTEGALIQTDALDQVLDADPASGLVKVEAGITLAALNEELHRLGLAMENLGDIDSQTVAGAICTGTHGTGARLRNISAQVEGLELTLADGSVRELTADREPELLRAARVSLGALGAISSVTLRCVPAFTLHRIDTPRPLDQVLGSIEELAERNDHFEFFVFPYTETALTLERNRTERPPRPRNRASAWLGDVLVENIAGDLLLRLTRRRPSAIPRFTRLAAKMMSQGERFDRSYRIFANERRIRFTEMEYGIPREHGPEAVRRVLELIRERHLQTPMPIEFRVVAPDDALLSPSHERETAYIAVHQYRGMEWRPYFEAVEAIMDDYGGRPHWGKRHFQTRETLARRYPRFAEFLAVREELDPRRVFRNGYTDRVLGP